MIQIDNLYSYIADFLMQNIVSSTVIYFAIGSESFNRNWSPNENQQFPPFLHNFKIKNFNSKILVIIIDPLLAEKPFIVQDNNSFLSNSWTFNEHLPNVFISNMGVEVIAIKSAITWQNKTIFDNSLVHNDITLLLIELYKLILNYNTLLFYHEFTGVNVLLLEEVLENKICTNKHICFNKNKICIDITRGSDNYCFTDLSKPENYPLIQINDNVISYINIDNINEDYKKELVSRFKVNHNIDYRTNDDYLLFLQILKKDYIMTNLLKETFITLFRQVYTSNNENIVISAKFLIKEFQISKFYLKKYSNIIENIELNLDKIKCYNVDKNILLNDLCLIIYNIVVDIGYKYAFDENKITKFINKIIVIEDKYQINHLFDNFIAKNFKLLKI